MTLVPLMSIGKEDGSDENEEEEEEKEAQTVGKNTIGLLARFASLGSEILGLSRGVVK
jgi:hypothetical protein